MGWDSPLRSSLRLPARPVLDLGARRAELARWTGVWRGLPARGEDPSPAQSRGRPGQLSCGWWSTVTLPDGPAGQPGSGTPRTRLGGACDVHRALAQLTQFVCSQQAPSRERYLQPPPPGPLTLSPTGGRRGRLSESPQTHSQQRQSSPGHRLATSRPWVGASQVDESNCAVKTCFLHGQVSQPPSSPPLLIFGMLGWHLMSYCVRVGP